MKTLITYSFIAIIYLIPHSLLGQGRFKNAININSSYAKFSGTDGGNMKSPYNMLGLSYERRFKKKFQVGIAYSYYNPKFLSGRPLYNTYTHTLPDGQNLVGFLWRRKNYRYLDVTMSYSLILGAHGDLSAGIGPSCNWGTNQYVTYFWSNPGPPYDAILGTESKDETFLGITANVKYSFCFLKDRLRAGAFVVARYYPSLLFQMDTGIKLGVNF